MSSKAEENALQKKVQFHRDLASLEESDGNEDAGLQESLAALRRPKKQLISSKDDIPPEKRLVRKSPTADDDSRSSRSLPRSISDLGPSTSSKSHLDAQPERGLTPSKKQGNDTSLLTARHTFSGALPPTSSMPQATGKRKRDNVITPMPKDQQIFSNLHFYFFPNNEKHPARFMRISKAIAFGAIWHRDWTPFVTHVIVDKSLDYAMLLKFLNRDSLPVGIICVNESWPSECIAYRALLDYNRPQFRVLGTPTPAVPEKPAVQAPASSTNSETSLKLKPPGKDVTTRQPETQSSGESADVHNETAPLVVATDTYAADAGPDTTDELNVAISQARDLQMMPLDEDDKRPSSSEGLPANVTSTSNHEGQGSKRNAFQDNFQCMQKHSGEISNNANAATIVILQQMADYYGKMGDEWRIRAYRKAIATLRNHPKKVCTKDSTLR